MATLLVLAAAACGPSDPVHDPVPHVEKIDAGQAEYTFHGCANENGALCPRSKTAACALDLLNAGGASICVYDWDCELVSLKDPCLGVCGPVAANADGFLDVRRAMQAEIDRYCRLGPCKETPCANPIAQPVPICALGFCKAIPADAGEADASRGDAATDADAGLADRDS